MTIKRKIIVTAGGLFAVLGVITYQLIAPTLGDIGKIAAAIQNERLDLEKKYQQGQRIKKIAAEYRKIVPLREQLNTMYIPYGDELRFFELLEGLQQKYGVEAIPTTNQLGSGKGGEQPLPLTLTIRGDFTKALQYLIALERLNYYYNIGSIVVSPTNPERGEVTLTLGGHVYLKSYHSKTPGLQSEMETLDPTATTTR